MIDVNEFYDVDGQLVRPFDKVRLYMVGKNAFYKARLDMVAKYALPGRGGYFTEYFDNKRIGKFTSIDPTTGIKHAFHEELARIQIPERFDVKRKARQN